MHRRMRNLSRWVQLLRHQGGRRLRLGERSYRVRGFQSNGMALSADHEANIVPALRTALLRCDGAVLDVGVNTGQTLLKILALDPARPYVGFEPQVACCAALARFCRDNALRHVAIVPVALGEDNRLHPIYSSGGYDEMASLASAIRPDLEPHRYVSWTQCRAGDEVLAEIGVGKVALLKIDVEGFELQVLRGLARTLQAQRPTILFEQLPNFFGEERTRYPEAHCASNSQRADRIRQYLVELGYLISQILPSGETAPIDRFDLDSTGDYAGHNYLATNVH